MLSSLAAVKRGRVLSKDVNFDYKDIPFDVIYKCNSVREVHLVTFSKIVARKILASHARY